MRASRRFRPEGDGLEPRAMLDAEMTPTPPDFPEPIPPDPPQVPPDYTGFPPYIQGSGPALGYTGDFSDPSSVVCYGPAWPGTNLGAPLGVQVNTEVPDYWEPGWTLVDPWGPQTMDQ
jgi:hypothetical protein